MISWCVFIDNKGFKDLQTLFFHVHLHDNSFLIKTEMKNIFQADFILIYFTSNAEDNS